MLDAIVIGAGFAGLRVLHQRRDRGFAVHAFEAGGDVGGTWYWNSYPGARCDIESKDYCFIFDRRLHDGWTWTERFAGQPEILRYARYVADYANLLPHITFDTAIRAAEFDEASATWTVVTDAGDTHRCRYLIAAVGCMSAPYTPELPGLAQYEGVRVHTGRWPRAGVDFRGRRVGIVGTGSSGIQLIPRIAEAAAELTVFQRTPNFSAPARNRPLTPAEQQAAAAEYEDRVRYAGTTRFGHHIVGTGRPTTDFTAAERDHELEIRWQRGGTGILATFTDSGMNLAANSIVAEFFRRKIAAAVHDPDTARGLQPRTYPIGTKRLCVDSGYFETYNRANVTLVDLRDEPIRSCTRTGIRTTAREFRLEPWYSPPDSMPSPAR
ncbi:NAD(P)/FAD-dependent oxidoreductase [Nocardia sp. CDC159]|uniref:NAD(P)/FAD-dependent oxidoreductase n=1 Tax=Nocardia pulmonis TaxID=2951408 RepID=A0A9X2IUY2_9NOCA|nr:MULTISPECIES: NAD(P)/FAD-dependent oxidoreductase [Nocardia]MCM6772643.1 NAD(P)/FAD-dependent oxidoreductase [Nocardia pulmonis]MCM6786054.1 NAD(P)/FAD-dependent oxidoreductase [Nocardia sp. CDC159]